MSIKSFVPDWTIPDLATETHIRKYSTTGDILSFKRCPRQYGFFGVRGFSSATNTQRYFGTLVHDVLDRINRDYRESPTLPDREAIQQLVEEAHERLIRSGVRPYNSRAQRDYAVDLIERFVVLIGPAFFKHVKETEYRLERALQTRTGRDYVLTGVVDVLSGAVSHSLGLTSSTMADDIEIWDYKSGKMPPKGSRELQDYEYQMWVYAELYRQQSGEYPARSVLIFVGELGDDDAWVRAQTHLETRRQLVQQSIYPIHPTDRHVRLAMEDFHRTVEAIEAERSRSYVEQWAAPPGDYYVDEATCEACELRYNCSHFEYCDPRRARRERAEPL